MKTLSSVGIGIVALALLSGAPSKTLAQLTWDITPGTVGVGDGMITGGAGAWNTTGTNGVWTSDGGANNVAWVNNATTPSSAIFSGAPSGTVTVTTVNVQDITFDTTAGYILSGSTITLGDTTAGDQTNPTITANVNATINSVLAGNDGLVKAGGGTLTLGGNNTFTGDTSVTGGTLAIVTASLPDYAGNIAVSSGATWSVNDTAGLNLSGNTSGAGTILNNGSSFAYFNGVATQFTGFTGTLQTTAGATYLAFPAGNGAVNTKMQVNGGSLVIGPNGSTTGTWQIGELSGTGGIVRGNAGNLVLQTGALGTSTTYAGVIQNGGTTLGLTKVGAGTLTLTGANIYMGATLVSNGTLLLGAGGDFNRISTSSAITISTGGTLTTANLSAHNIGSLTLSGGIIASGSPNGTFGSFIFQQSVIVNGSVASTISASGVDLFAGDGTRNFTVNDVTGDANVDLNVTGTFGAFGTDGLNKLGGGTMRLASQSTYTGGTTVGAGTLVLADPTINGVGTIRGVLTINAGATVSSTTADSLGYTVGSQVTTMNINGGTYNNAVGGNQGFSTNLSLTGGTMTSTGGGSFFFNTGFGITGNASAITSTISGPIVLSNSNNLSVAVASGTTPSGIDLNISGAISSPGAGNNGALTKTGGGVLRIAAANAYTSGTTITAGTLLVSNSSGSGVGTGDVSINGGTLGGTGLLGTAGDASNIAFTALGGTIAPGESAGQLTVFGDVNFTSAGTKNFAVELNGLTIGTLYDQLVVNAATGGGNLINLANASLLVSLGFLPSMNDEFTIINNNTASAIIGTFNGLANGSTFLVNTTTFRINYDAGTGNDVVLTVVPEPSSLAILLFGGVLMWVFKGKRVR